MTGPTAIVRRIVEHHWEGGTILLLSDFDGTLTEFAPTPQQAVLSESTRELLRTFTKIPRIHVGVISGRAIDDLRPQVGIDEVLLAGTGGLELSLDGRVDRPPVNMAIARLPDAMTHLNRLLNDEPTAWLESKPLAITVHLAHVPNDRRPPIRQKLRVEFGQRFPDLRLIDCVRGLEILPELGLNKATAIRRMMDHVGADMPLVVFAGNDGNDADALAIVDELEGIAIAVGPAAPPAAQRLKSPADFVLMLQELMAALFVAM